MIGKSESYVNMRQKMQYEFQRYLIYKLRVILVDFVVSFSNPDADSSKL